MTVSIQTLMTGRCHARNFLHAWCKGKHGPQLAVGVMGESHTRLFRDLVRGNVPARLEAFPALFFCSRILPKAVDWLELCPAALARAFILQNSSYIGSTRKCFYAAPFAQQPYTFQLFKVLHRYSSKGAKKWKR
jgi:hypothetical protein